MGAKEEAELKRLKDKQAARKEIRAEQDRLQAQKKKEKEGGKKSSGPAMDARKEMSKTKEQVEEEMKISLRIRIKPLDLDSMDSDELKAKAQKIFDTILQLETDKYDYEQRQLDQDYELKELAERQKLQQRNKAIKKGLDPESFTQKHPPTIRMFSKYERRTDTRSYGDRKKLYEGGAEVIRAEWLEFVEGEVRRVLKAARQEAAKVVRSPTRQKGWRSGDARGGGRGGRRGGGGGRVKSRHKRRRSRLKSNVF